LLPKPQVNHLSTKDDNRACVLEWVTAIENVAHANKHIVKSGGVKINKLDPNTRQILKTYNKIQEVKADGFRPNAVSIVLSGKFETHKGFKWERVVVNEVVEIYENEIWEKLKDCSNKEINQYKNYEISNYARARNIEKNKILKLDVRHRISLHVNNISKTYYIHRLMMLVFNVPNPENKPEVDHIDGNYHNNKLDNLRWATGKENVNNEATKRKASRIVEVTFPDNHVEEIVGIWYVAKRLNVTDGTIARYIKNNQEYKGHIFKEIFD
jgi:hypothetical protein